MKKQIVLAISVVLGVLAGLLTHVYVSAKEGEVEERIQRINRKYGTMWALVYQRDVPVGTVLAKSDLALMEVPALGMRGQALQEENLGEAIGRKTLLGHRAREVVFWSDLEGGDRRATGLSDDIKRQMRAISIDCGGSAAVSGMVKPNDHVDVIGTFTFPSADGKVRQGDVETRTILQNALVLAIGQTTAKDRRIGDPMARNVATVTLEVTPREAEVIAFAEQMRGKLKLTLRNRNDTTFEEKLPTVDYEMIKGELEELNRSRQQKKLYGGR